MILNLREPRHNFKIRKEEAYVRIIAIFFVTIDILRIFSVE